MSYQKPYSSVVMLRRCLFVAKVSSSFKSWNKSIYFLDEGVSIKPPSVML
jgi:hypothetical protein